jgi:hypothetical protein
MICPHCKKEVEMLKQETDESGRITNYFSCGHKHFEITFNEKINLLEMFNVKKKGIIDFSKDHKFEYEETVGERIGKDGNIVFIHQVIDRINNFYKKFVRQGGKIIKNIQEKLTSHK